MVLIAEQTKTENPTGDGQQAIVPVTQGHRRRQVVADSRVVSDIRVFIFV